MHDVKQGARTLVCHQIVDRYGKIQKLASQGTQEHRRLVDQDRKNRKYLFKGTHGRRQLHDDDSKVVSSSSMQHRMKSLKHLQGRSRAKQGAMHDIKQGAGTHSRRQFHNRDCKTVNLLIKKGNEACK